VIALVTAKCLTLAAADQPSDESTSAVIDVLPPQLLMQPAGANWPSYNGDFTGRRYSRLAQVNLSNVL